MKLFQLLAALILVVPADFAQQPAPPPGARYVAMGSSFAAGPGVTVQADAPPTRCSRSRDNYAHQLARRRGLALTDVGCSGAVTAHLLGPWNELAPQLDAVTPETRLVTVTIGGNDVGLTRSLGQMAACTASGAPCVTPSAPPEADWEALRTHMADIAAEVRRRAPAATLVFVDYTSVLPPGGTCPALGLTAVQADYARAINARVVEITARAAEAAGSRYLAASVLTADHNACAEQPWANGAPPVDGAAFHPRLEAHRAIAQALNRLIWPSSGSSGDPEDEDRLSSALR